MGNIYSDCFDIGKCGGLRNLFRNQYHPLDKRSFQTVRWTLLYNLNVLIFLGLGNLSLRLDHGNLLKVSASKQQVTQACQTIAKSEPLPPSIDGWTE